MRNYFLIFFSFFLLSTFLFEKCSSTSNDEENNVKKINFSTENSDFETFPETREPGNTNRKYKSHKKRKNRQYSFPVRPSSSSSRKELDNKRRYKKQKSLQRNDQTLGETFDENFWSLRYQNNKNSVISERRRKANKFKFEKIESNKKQNKSKNKNGFKKQNKKKKDRTHFTQTSRRRTFLDDLPKFSKWTEISTFPEVDLEQNDDDISYDIPIIHTVPSPERLQKKKRPNIVLIMADDLDIELGSLNYMPKMLRMMGQEGALFSNAYTSTPMCCPSRSSMLTGMYIHNHNVYTNHQNCSSPAWQNTHERRSFASYLSNAGYKTGYFGKYLNRYDGAHVPEGWQDWGALLMNSRYYNYTVNRNNVLYKYGNRYPQDYYPHVVTKDGEKFLKNLNKEDPFLLVLSYPAPHGPEDSAPEHAHKFFNALDHHTASYNYAPNPDKQWVLQFTKRMPEIQLKFTDLLMTKRLQTLQTVDTAIENFIERIRNLGELDNTYFFFTSDHGYHLGQYGLTKGKSMPFEFDIKVPFLVRGPGIKASVELPQIALNVDLAPTFLDIAGIARPPHMDGRSMLPILKSSNNPEDAKAVPWRESFIVESSGRVREEEVLAKKDQRTWERQRALSDTLAEVSSNWNSSSLGSPGAGLYTSKHERLEEVCKKPEFQFPCHEQQKWHCVRVKRRWKIKKCRVNTTGMWQRHCICNYQQGLGTYTKLEPMERRKQKNFLKKYGSKDFLYRDTKFVKAFTNIEIPSTEVGPSRKRNKRKFRGKRRLERSLDEIVENDDVINDYDTSTLEFDNQNNKEDTVHTFVEEEEIRDLEDQIMELSDELEILKETTNADKDCHGSLNECPELKVAENPMATRDQIRRLKQQLLFMKNILESLKSQKPISFLEEYENSFGKDYLYENSEMGDKSFKENSSFMEPEVGSDLTDLFDSLNASFEMSSNNKNYFGKDEFASHRPSLRKTGRNKVNSPKKLFHVNLDDLDESLKNSTISKECWCNGKIMKKIEIKKARDRRRLERLVIKNRRSRKNRQRKKKKREKEMFCDYPKLNCYTHNNDHWKTPPLWTDGNFCFCINSANNTYWCLRTIKDDQNFLYCEFITGLITYYDLHIDPYQLRNVAFTLSNEKVWELHNQLTALRSCKGADECDGFVQPKVGQPKKEEKNDGWLKLSDVNATYYENYGASNERRNQLNRKVKKIELRKRLRKERKKLKQLLKDKSLLDESDFPSIEQRHRMMKKENKIRRQERKLKKRRRKRKNRKY